MSAKPADPRTTLQQWREQQLDRHDPVGFAVLDALQARAAAHAGQARQILEQRLATRMADYANALPRASTIADVASPAPRSPLAALLADLAQRPRAEDTEASAYPALPAVDAFRALWTQVRSQSQVRQSLGAAPSDGGPLNSAVLVQRAIALMGDTSPGYLKHFLGYVDNLAWLEQLQPRNLAPARDAGRVARPRRPRAAKP